MPRRPESRPAKAILSPSPSSPRRRLGGDPYAVEAHRGGVRAGQAHLALGRVGGQARRRRPGPGSRRCRGRLRLVAGAGHDLVEVGVAAVGGPGLGAVEDVVVAVAPGRRTHRGRVGAGVGLGEAVGAEQVAGEHVGQPLLLLLLGALGDQPEAGQCVHRDPDADRGPDRADLLEHLQVDLVGERRRRRTPRGRAARAGRSCRASGRRRAGRSPSASAGGDLGEQLVGAIWRTRRSRSACSSVARTRRAGMRPRLARDPPRPTPSVWLSAGHERRRAARRPGRGPRRGPGDHHQPPRGAQRAQRRASPAASPPPSTSSTRATSCGSAC